MVRAINEEKIRRQALTLRASDSTTKPLDFPSLERRLWDKITTMTLWEGVQFQM